MNRANLHLLFVLIAGPVVNATAFTTVQIDGEPYAEAETVQAALVWFGAEKRLKLKLEKSISDAIAEHGLPRAYIEGNEHSWGIKAALFLLGKSGGEGMLRFPGGSQNIYWKPASTFGVGIDVNYGAKVFVLVSGSFGDAADLFRSFTTVAPKLAMGPGTLAMHYYESEDVKLTVIVVPEAGFKAGLDFARNVSYCRSESCRRPSE